jgi:hypothetical protein
MGSITRTVLVLACSAALAGGMALPASAANTTTTVEVAGGVLTMSAPASADIVTPVSPGDDAIFALSSISVTDTRAGILGWETTASVTDFVGLNVAHIIAKVNATYEPTQTATTGTATFTPSGEVSLGAAAIVEAATVVTGNNSATWDADLTVAVPDAALADDYTAILTHSVV